MARKFLLYVFSAIFIFGTLAIVSAASNAPTDLTISNNVTLAYDEGTFFVNWTAPVGGDDVNNYTIYVSNDGGTTFNNKSINNSETGFSFSNTTQGNYTFVVGANNVTGTVETNSTINVSIFIDRTAPAINLPVYTNATAKKNTAQLTLNISVSDANSGTTGSTCLFDINGTNESVSVSSGWCNTTSLNLTSLADGNNTINVYVNDTVNIFGLDNSFAVLIDTAAPTATATCLPSTIQTGDSFPCTCSGTDATAGIDTSTGTSSSGSTTVTSSTGVFTYTCSVTYLAGNAGTATQQYTITQPPSTGRSSGSSTTISWTTNTLSDDVFSQGYTGKLAVNSRFSMQINGETHYIGVLSLTSEKVTIEVSSDPIQVSLNVGEDTKVDVDNDGFYDVYILLNGISDGADLTVKKIYEEVTENSLAGEGNNTGTETSSQGDESGRNTIWIWILVGVFVLWGIWRLRKDKN